MEVTIRKTFELIPEWEGNLDEPEDKQIVFTFKFLSGEDISNVFKHGEPDLRKDWLSYCIGVKNLKVNGEVATPESVYLDPGVSDLYVEMKLRFKKEKEVDKKKLKSDSGLSIVEKKKS